MQRCAPAGAQLRLGGAQRRALAACTQPLRSHLRTATTASASLRVDIQAVLDPDGRRRFLTLLCVERAESGQLGE